MHLTKSVITAFAIFSWTRAAPLPLPIADDAYSYNVVNVDGSNLQSTSSIYFDSDSNGSSTIGVAEPTTTHTTTTSSYTTEVVTGLTTVEEDGTVVTIGYTTTSTYTIKGKKRTVWITETEGDAPAPNPSTAQPSTIEETSSLPTLTSELSSFTLTQLSSTSYFGPATPTSTEIFSSTIDAASSLPPPATFSSVPSSSLISTSITEKEASQVLTVIGGTTFIVSKVVSTIRPATTITFLSTFTSTYGTVVSVGVQTISSTSLLPSSTLVASAVSTTIAASVEATSPLISSTLSSTTIELATSSTSSSSQISTSLPHQSAIPASSTPTVSSIIPRSSTSSSNTETSSVHSSLSSFYLPSFSTYSSYPTSTSSYPTSTSVVPSSLTSTARTSTPSLSSPTTASTSTSTRTRTSSSSSSTITTAPQSSSVTESGTPYTTIVSDGVCEVYYYDDSSDTSIYYVSGTDAIGVSSTTTITSIIYATVTLN